jgi:hypothetical protein
MGYRDQSVARTRPSLTLSPDSAQALLLTAIRPSLLYDPANFDGHGVGTTLRGATFQRSTLHGYFPVETWLRSNHRLILVTTVLDIYERTRHRAATITKCVSK